MKAILTACAVMGLGLAVAQPALADNQPGTASAVQSAFAGVKKQHYTIYVLPGSMGFVGPDKQHHDTIAPSDFVLKAGVPVTFTVVNFDDGSHSITSQGLGLNIMIKPGKDEPNGGINPTVTTYTLTPTKKGEFRWNCMVMCDGPSHWAMSSGFDGPGQDGYMAGWIKVF
jgi:heme/copper-type cytochrome/quinol oxidase subunit 2